MIVFLFHIIQCVLFFSSIRNIKRPRIVYIIIAICQSQSNFLSLYTFDMLGLHYPYMINISGVLFTMLIICIFIRSYQFNFTHFSASIVVITGVTITLVFYSKCIYNIQISWFYFRDAKTNIVLLVVCRSEFSRDDFTRKIFQEWDRDLRVSYLERIDWNNYNRNRILLYGIWSHV
jgi:hypothetical protein